MKKIRLIGLAIVTLVLLVVGAAAPALAHSGDSDNNAYSGAYIDGPTLTRLAQTFFILVLLSFFMSLYLLSYNHNNKQM